MRVPGPVLVAQLPTQLPAHVPGKAAEDGLGNGSLKLMWETRKAPGFGLE